MSKKPLIAPDLDNTRLCCFCDKMAPDSTHKFVLSDNTFEEYA